jgi:hypothetical protein
MGGPKRHIQPERYTPFVLKFVGKIMKNTLDPILKIIYSGIIKFIQGVEYENETFDLSSWLVSIG